MLRDDNLGQDFLGIQYQISLIDPANSHDKYLKFKFKIKETSTFDQ